MVLVKFMLRIIRFFIPVGLLDILRKQTLYVKYKSKNTIAQRLKILDRTIGKSVIPILYEYALPNEHELIVKFMQSFNLAKNKQNEVETPYKPGADWEKLLNSEWRLYKEAISKLDVDVMSQFLRNFFRNEGISGFWGSTDMFTNFCKSNEEMDLYRAEMMMKQYHVWKNLNSSTPIRNLEAPKVGNPWGYKIEGVLLYEPVFEYHFQATYFTKLLSNLIKPVIIEIGGGFGGLAFLPA